MGHRASKCFALKNQAESQASPASPSPVPAEVTCVRPGCDKKPWNGKQGEYCSKSCKSNAEISNAKPKITEEAIVQLSMYVPSAEAFQAVVMSPGSHEYNKVMEQYMKKWDTKHKPVTQIRAIFDITTPSAIQVPYQRFCQLLGNVPTFGWGTNPGNVQRRFHGTRMTCRFDGTLCSDWQCSACRILEGGFDMSKLGAWSGNNGLYGGGIYFTSMSSTAKGYGLDKKGGYTFQNGNWDHPDAGNCILVCNVACGNCEKVGGQETSVPEVSQYQSRIVDKSTGVDELIVWHSIQVLPRFLIVF